MNWMTHRLKPFLFVTLAALVGLALSVSAQQPSATPQQSSVENALHGALGQLRFLDSETGYAVKLDEFILLDTTGKRLREQKFPALVSAAAQADWEQGRVQLAVPAGRYRFVARAAGYRASSAEIEAGGAQSPPIEVFLDPLAPPEELSPARLRALRSPAATLIAGFVVDDATGQPLAGAEVRQAGGEARALTNARGYFHLLLPVPPATEGIATANLLVVKPGYRTEVRSEIELMPGGDWVYRLRLVPGEGSRTIDERNYRRRGQPAGTEPDAEDEPDHGLAARKTDASADSCRVAAPATQLAVQSPATVIVPSTIRVGRNCPTATTCSSVEIYSLETYSRRVLPAEWFPCWGSLTGGINSLAGGAVPIRSYGAWHVYNPRALAYDICDTTSCQVFGSSTTSNTDAGVNMTASVVLVDFNRSIFRTEYSAEQNNTGCGDCATGQCLFDPVCCGSTANGHGRGMCQYGTVRWATGTRVSTSSPCGLGPQLTYGTKDWQALLTHYYPALSAAQGAELAAGDRVIATQNLDVRNNPGTACGNCSTEPACSSCVQCIANAGSRGTVASGPMQANALTWFQIQWDSGTATCPNGTIGWSTENTVQRETPGVVAELNTGVTYATGSLGGPNPAPRGISIREANGRTENWTASLNVPWATLAASAGQTPGLIRINFNLAGLAPGTYNGTLTAQSPTSAFSPLTAQIVLVVNAAPVGNVERSASVTQGRVDGYDLMRLLRAFGSVPGSPNWDPAVNLADLDANNNGVIDPTEIVIDGSDLAELARNFGILGS